MMRKFRWCLLILLLPFYAYSAADPSGISVTASVNKTALTLEDELILTVTVDGAMGDFNPQLPSMPAFNVYARSTSKQIQNFHATSVFEYIMMPRFPGEAVINPITLQYGNRTYRTEPITVTVYRTTPAKSQNTAPARTTVQPASNAPVSSQQAPANMPALERSLYNQAARNGNQDFFIVSAVSNKTPYASQTFSLGVRFYYSKPFSDSAPYTAPTISNLFLEEVNRSDGKQIIDGKQYQYAEIRYAATGVTAGKAEVGPAQVTYVPVNQRNLSLFDRMFASLSAEPQTISSKAITLDIRPVPPQGQPSSFYGAVGSGYSISASLDREQVEAGDAVNLSVKVNGPGNLKPTSDLKMPDITGLKTYDVASSSAVSTTNGSLKSYKIFKTVLVPLSSGNYTIPALPWSYYDPVLQQYRTIYTDPISLSVTPSTKTESGFDFSSHISSGNGVQTLGKDIHYLKSDAYQQEWNLFAKLASWKVCNYVALAWLIFTILFVLLAKTTLVEKHALAQTKSQLKHAKNEQTVADALSSYLQLKYNLNTASLPLRHLQAALVQKGCPAPLAERFTHLWQQLDAARFAPIDLQGQSTQELSQQALEIVRQMDKQRGA